MSVEEKLEFLTQEVCQTRQEVEEKLESSLGQEVNAAQEKMTQDVPRKTGNTSYQLTRLYEEAESDMVICSQFQAQGACH